MSANQAWPVDATRFSVVIPTHNRCHLVGRAIESVLRQESADLELLVVDDASSDATEATVQQLYPQARYLRQDSNQGPGPARQRGLQAASHPWVVMLDDDDCLDPFALATITEELARWPEAARYPVLMFARDTGRMSTSFRVMRIEDFANRAFSGDWVEVVRRELFLAAGLSYPATRLGGENLLWMTVAEKYGLPMWNRRIGSMGTDAPCRLTAVAQQIRHAEEHARLQEMNLAAFGDRLQATCPSFVCQRHLGAATYWLLAGKPSCAREHYEYLATHGHHSKVVALRLLSKLPARCLGWIFLAYRWITQSRCQPLVRS
jgi:GalNAc5-diNAcBac-PP-undecaprenol beta-1,3-glucosyltransferase